MARDPELAECIEDVERWDRLKSDRWDTCCYAGLKAMIAAELRDGIISANVARRMMALGRQVLDDECHSDYECRRHAAPPQCAPVSEEAPNSLA